MTLATLASFALVQMLIAMSPGPAAVLAIRTATVDGARAALTLSLGLAIGIAIWALTALAGLSFLFEIMPWVQTGLRLAGGFFLIWIGISLWRDAPLPLPQSGADVPRSSAAALGLGIWTNLANPKALAYFAAVFTGLLPTDLSLAEGALVLALVFGIEIAWYAVLALLFSRPAPRRYYTRLKTGAERIFGVLLAGFGLKIVFS